MNLAWDARPLQDICHFINGLWKGKRPPFVAVDVLRNTNFSRDGLLDYSNVAHLDVEERQFASRRLQYGDIILEKSGGGPNQPVGRVGLFDRRDGAFSLSNFTSAVRVADQQRLDFRFLHKCLYWLHASGLTESLQTHSTGIRNLDMPAYKRLVVPLPPLAEQQHIVDCLDRGFEMINAARINTEEALIKAGILVDLARVVTWDNDSPREARRRTLQDLCELIVDCEHKTAPYQENGIPSIRTPNVGKGYLLLDDVRRVSEETYEIWTRRAKPRAGDLVLAREAPAGNVAVIPSGLTVCLGQRTVLLRPRSDLLDPMFLALLLLQPEAQERLLSSSRGATVEHVNLKDIRALTLRDIPPIDQQRVLVAKTESRLKVAHALEPGYVSKLAALDELKLAMLRSAFSGKLSNAKVVAA